MRAGILSALPSGRSVAAVPGQLDHAHRLSLCRQHQLIESLLATLMAAPTRVFSRARLLDTVFIGVDSDGTIDLNVHYLRRKLGKTVIRTVHGAGYRFGLE